MQRRLGMRETGMRDTGIRESRGQGELGRGGIGTTLRLFAAAVGGAVCGSGNAAMVWSRPLMAQENPLGQVHTDPAPPAPKTAEEKKPLIDGSGTAAAALATSRTGMRGYGWT